MVNSGTACFAQVYTDGKWRNQEMGLSRQPARQQTFLDLLSLSLRFQTQILMIHQKLSNLPEREVNWGAGVWPQQGRAKISPSLDNPPAPAVDRSCSRQGYNNPTWLLLMGEGSGLVLFSIFCGGGNGLREVQVVSLAHLARRWGESKLKSECSDSKVLTSLIPHTSLQQTTWPQSICSRGTASGGAGVSNPDVFLPTGKQHL